MKQAAEQLGVPYYSLADWRQKRKNYGDHAFVGSGIRRDAPLSENERQMMKQIRELQKANEILKDALGFFAKDRKKNYSSVLLCLKNVKSKVFSL